MTTTEANTNTAATATKKIGWTDRSKAEHKARAVGGRVIQLESGRYVVRGQTLIGRDGKLSCVYYGPRGATYDTI